MFLSMIGLPVPGFVLANTEGGRKVAWPNPNDPEGADALSRDTLRCTLPVMFARIYKFLDGLSPSMLVALLTGVTFVIGYFDYLAGTDTTFSAIYLLPIGIAAWFLKRWTAYALAILSSILWLSGDVAAGAQYASIVIPLWNLAARFAIFIFATQLIFESRKLHDGLESRAAERAAKLTAEIATRERLQRELLQISEREQERVGHDIHDSLCQHLTGTALAGQVLAESLQSDSKEADDAFRVVELIEEGIFLARNLARGLNAVELSNNGLTAALSDFAASTSDLFNISCRLECPQPFLVDDMHAAVHLYRIAQEAVGNAIKHGEAKNVTVRLEDSQSGKLLRVLDDGVGLPPMQINGRGMGLRIMSYRSELIGAKLDVRSQGTRGTVVTCLLPVQEAGLP
jgi:signal transduction histidine kinase